MESRATKSKAVGSHWDARRLRACWAQFFSANGHREIASASLIPAQDPTLLFTTAGMVQFKDYFSGSSNPPARRLFSIQKCLRTTDLANVGQSSRHCTFFEMLGNFSFGDYFKSEAIRYAWQFSLSVLGFDPKSIHVTIYQEDKEAEEIWKREIGLPKEQIHRLGKEHNWWGPAGASGPCGPCSELYLDRGSQLCENCSCSDKSRCAPGGEGDRYIEYWNLVFNQYYQDQDASLQPLATPGIDTGAGLERMVALLNGCESIYNTPELQEIISLAEEKIAQLRPGKEQIRYSLRRHKDHKDDRNHKDRKDHRITAAFRVIADHLRAAVFSIADGIFPENVGRGYVLRRLVRRSLLYARDLDIHAPILAHLAPKVVEIYGETYPELLRSKADIQKHLLVEEERFLQTLETGLSKWHQFLELNRERNRSKGLQQPKGAPVFSGRDAFILYDTYGFPLEITIEMAEQAGLAVDKEEFEKEMEMQRSRSALSSVWKKRARQFNLSDLRLAPTHFTGYDGHDCQARVTAIIYDGQSKASLSASGAASSADSSVEVIAGGAIIVLDKTPFYAEGGGQIGDSGALSTADGSLFIVEDTQKQGGSHLHIGRLEKGSLEKGMLLNASIDRQKRHDIACHHSATHLLNHVLREKLGRHVAQMGSLVAPDHLRFDFSHSAPIPAELLEEIIDKVNQAIEERGTVETRILPIEEARSQGAIAAFGEKYGSKVRVVSMGRAGSLSMEFCGGCHVKDTGEVGLFYIDRQSSPGAGSRRIEALAGRYAAEKLQEQIDELRDQIQSCNERIRHLYKMRDKVRAEANMPSDTPSYTPSDIPPDPLLESLSFIPSEDLPLQVAQELDSPQRVVELHRSIRQKKDMLQRAGKFLGKIDKRKGRGGGALPAALLESAIGSLASAKIYGSTKVLSLLLDEQEPQQLRLLADYLKERRLKERRLKEIDLKEKRREKGDEEKGGIVILLGCRDRGKPFLLFSADRAALEQGVNAALLIREVAPSIRGGGGGRPDLAQAGGGEAAGLPQALQLAEEMLRDILTRDKLARRPKGGLERQDG